MVGFHQAVLLGVEQMVAVAARLLGQVHGLVGVAQQGVGVGVVERVEGDADARRNADRVAADLEGRGDGGEDAVEDLAAFVEVAE